jgi:hypothetical protein
MRRLWRPRQAQLFLSHAHDEAEMAVAFAEWLESVFPEHVKVVCTSRPGDRIGRGMVTSGIVDRIRDSGVSLALLTPQSISEFWLYYEMGAAHALGVTFVPCLAGGLRFADLPPQAYEYQGAELISAENVVRLVRDLAQILDLQVSDDVHSEAMADVLGFRAA